jgi:hypothetical protein
MHGGDRNKMCSHRRVTRAGLALARSVRLGPWRVVLMGPPRQRRSSQCHRGPPRVARRGRRRPASGTGGVDERRRAVEPAPRLGASFQG